ncbi:uncharacterized protein Z518_05639 [Rhinocladiella mackenziei CBS 650.93]|uniref:Uncharacterized protein n=1 Tax=Rhinocladiella mackenziei CBS 650.93 TaxID=1442369 RepID=A0A0D2IG47_9EURO|nr:uncharacterized protein Z518_05639 [Rhinocladiella mackenziei CBS 650.93]KIX04769.1 hypothetical protein Z518_05639 [Rhinocladiella mackenziei CBS 650.93]
MDYIIYLIYILLTFLDPGWCVCNETNATNPSVFTTFSPFGTIISPTSTVTLHLSPGIDRSLISSSQTMISSSTFPNSLTSIRMLTVGNGTAQAPSAGTSPDSTTTLTSTKTTTTTIVMGGISSAVDVSGAGESSSVNTIVPVPSTITMTFSPTIFTSQYACHVPCQICHGGIALQLANSTRNVPALFNFTTTARFTTIIPVIRTVKASELSNASISTTWPYSVLSNEIFSTILPSIVANSTFSPPNMTSTATASPSAPVVLNTSSSVVSISVQSNTSALTRIHETTVDLSATIATTASHNSPPLSIVTAAASSLRVPSVFSLMTRLLVFFRGMDLKGHATTIYETATANSTASTRSTANTIVSMTTTMSFTTTVTEPLTSHTTWPVAINTTITHTNSVMTVTVPKHSTSVSTYLAWTSFITPAATPLAYANRLTVSTVVCILLLGAGVWVVL